MCEGEEGSDHAATIKLSLLQKVRVSEIVLFLECVSRNYIAKCLSEICILYYPIMLFDDMLLGHNSKLHPQTFPQSLQKGVTYGEGEG